VKKNGKIRVLHLGSPTGLYGAERWILALVNNINRDEIDPEVAVILDDPALSADLCRQAGKIGVRTAIFEAHGKFNWSAVKQIRSHIVKNDIDVLHTHGYKTDVIGIFAARRTNCKLITTPHGWSADAGFKLKIYESLDRGAFYFFDEVVPLSEDMYNRLKTIPFLRRKLRLIPNGVDLSEIDQAGEIAGEILEWKAKGNFVIGYIGQLIPRKGVDVLLSALEKMESDKWRLAIVGDGDSRQDLSRLVRESGLEDRVRFFGFRSDRLSFLRGFDAFVLPSHLEGVPRCLMEAMACRIPVVVSDIPGCRDLVRDGQSGLLFKPGDAHALRVSVAEVMRDSLLRERLASNARRTIEEEWSATALARRYSQLYRELTND
jgi:glycosyltransferase involved in cell wall biosynthesis